MRKLKHFAFQSLACGRSRSLPQRVHEPGDIFDETAGPGAHLAEGTRRMIKTAYRRWLGFLKEHHSVISCSRRRTVFVPTWRGPSSNISVPR